MSVRIFKVMTLLAATVLAGCAYEPYHSAVAVRDYDYGYSSSGFNDRSFNGRYISDRGFNDRYYDDFYYYPSVGIYFNIHSGHYYYQHKHRWVRTLTLPRHYQLHPNHRVHMKAHRDQPYRDYQKHSKNYRGDGDRWRQHDGRKDGRGDRDGDRRRYDRNDSRERQDRHSSVKTHGGPRRFEHNLQDDRRRQDQAVERLLRTRERIERTERSGDDRRRTERTRRIQDANTAEKRRTLYQDAQRRQELRRGQENRQPDGRVKRNSGRTDNTDARRHDARQQERQERKTSRSERWEARQAERRVDRKAERKAERIAERRVERRQAARKETQPAIDRARRTEGRADRLEAGPVRRRGENEAVSDRDLRWLRHNDRGN